MKKILKYWHISLLLLITTIQGYSQDSTSQVLVDKIVAVVGNEIILMSEIEMQILQAKYNGTTLDDDAIACNVLENMMQEKLLISQARIDSLDVSKQEVEAEAENRIRYLISQMGSQKDVERNFRRPMNKLRKEFEELAQNQLLSQRMYHSITSNVEVTPTDVEKFYKKIPQDSLPIISEQYIIYQIVKRPPADNAKINARTTLLDLRERITKGSSFQALAAMYSEDQGSASKGGELGMNVAQSYEPAFRDALRSLKPGQISQIVETVYGFHIIQLIDKQDNDMVNARHILIKPKYTEEDRKIAYTKLDSITDLINEKQYTFHEAAQLFSDDEKSRLSGGLLVNELELSSRFDKDQLEPSDYHALQNLKEGEISEPFETVDHLNKNTIYKVVMLKSRIPSHTANLKEDFMVLKNFTQNMKQQEVLKEWIEKKIEREYIKIDPKYRNCTFEFEGWVK